ncbi:hypothetical protein BG842_17770 [Haladaptatus sp. W1]|nr:hypothetical protein BG842_17770 [Haladaptatus sp. W1]
MRHCTRRNALRVTGIALFSSFAGCSALSTNSADSEDLSFERLGVTAVYVTDGVELSMPAEVQTVDNIHNADLLILPGDTDADAQKAVKWLVDDRVIALLGDSSEPTWLSWARSDTFGDAFQNRGYGDGEPDPSLIVAAKIGQYVETYRHTWGDDPSDNDVLRALDESLVTIEKKTSPE